MGSAPRGRAHRQDYTGGFQTHGLAEDVRLARCARVGAHRAALVVHRGAARRSCAGAIATSKWWKEERHGVFLDYNQNAKDRTVAAAYSVRPTLDARVSAPVTWDELDVCQPEDFTLVTMLDRYATLGDLHAGIDSSAGSIDGLLELSARNEREGAGDAPWPPHFRKQSGEPPRVSPSRAASAKDGGALTAGGPRRRPARARKAV